MRYNLYDLHVHTTASDGIFTPTEIVEQARAKGLAGLAVTDHDTLDGLAEAAEAARRLGLTLINGVELNCELCEQSEFCEQSEQEDTNPAGDTQTYEVHMLGFWLDPCEPRLADKLRQLQEHRRARGERMLQQLADLGMPLDTGWLTEYAEAGSIGRGQIARLLVQGGYAQDKEDAFERWLNPGRPGYAPRLHLSAAEAIELIHGAGGVAVMAHPIQAGNDRLPALLAAAGLDGLECRHPDQPGELAERYGRMAAELGLAVSAGSDCHEYGLGDFALNEAELERLARRRK